MVSFEPMESILWHLFKFTAWILTRVIYFAIDLLKLFKCAGYWSLVRSMASIHFLHPSCCLFTLLFPLSPRIYSVCDAISLPAFALYTVFLGSYFKNPCSINSVHSHVLLLWFHIYVLNPFWDEFWNWWEQESSFTLLHLDTEFAQHHLLTRLPFLYLGVLGTCWTSVGSTCGSHLGSGLFSVGPLCQYIIVLFQSQEVECLLLWYFSQDGFGYSVFCCSV